MRKVALYVFIVCSVLLLATVVMAAEPVQPTQKDKCPVCGMFVAKYPNWIAEIIFEDGSYAAFDGPKDMFRYYFNLHKYNKQKSQIKAIYVTEYYTTKLVRADAEDVYFILGSDVTGPMGKELVPVKGRQQAETFMKDHGGKKMLRFSEVAPDVLPKMKMMKMKGMKNMQMNNK